jgi:hypothetical protein
MSRRIRTVLLLGCAALLLAGVAQAQQSKLVLTGTTYTKWLWGNRNLDGSMYNFTTVPGEAGGDNGQGTELELFVGAKLSRAVEVRGRIHSRFSQNEWTNYGGFGGRDPAGSGGDCLGGDCGEFDPRSNQYVKLRGMTVLLTPGYKFLDGVTIGASDLGMFDAFSVGKIRYIDRDNAAGVFFQGSAAGKKVRWDATRISLPRLWAGPGFNTGNYTGADACYAVQAKVELDPKVNLAGVFDYVNDMELDPNDHNKDDGVGTRARSQNHVYGLKADLQPLQMIDISGAWYYSDSRVSPIFASDQYKFGLGGYGSVIGGHQNDRAWKADVDINDPFGVGLSATVEGFDIGAKYESVMAARRESDVLLTEGHDGAWGRPGPANAAYGIYSGNPTVIGYGGWDGNAAQVATISVDNEFTDFDEPMAETVIGWKGVTVVPKFSKGPLDLQGEYSHIGYNTNWQAWGDPTANVTSSWFPSMELDAGVGHNFRSAYAPFQDKKTDLAALNAKYSLAVGKGIDLFGKVKYIKEIDNRLNDPNFLPYNLDGTKHYYHDGFTTADLYPKPEDFPPYPAVPAGSWKTFNDIHDDDRDLKYTMFDLGAGYQLTNDLYGSLMYVFYNADLQDGNTAFRAYQSHEMASGKHTKNELALKFHYVLSGTDIGLEYEYNFGSFTPDFGTGFTPAVATADIAAAHDVPVGSLGVQGGYGSWNSLAKRDFTEHRLKAYMKIQF